LVKDFKINSKFEGTITIIKNHINELLNDIVENGLIFRGSIKLSLTEESMKKALKNIGMKKKVGKKKVSSG
jgi:hypothetical protein